MFDNTTNFNLDIGSWKTNNVKVMDTYTNSILVDCLIIS